jgi:NAD(P)-dependent dehydrogenase (short-subunit alcohol dehydrogenase family)
MTKHPRQLRICWCHQDSLSSFFSSEHVAKHFQNRIPLQREGNPKDVAELIVSLIQNDFITGENSVIEGGMNMHIV